MPFCNLRSRDQLEVAPNAMTKTFWGEKMLLSLIEMEPQTEVPTHQHPHEQVGIVLEGEVLLWIGTEKRLLKSGDCFIIPSNIDHGARTESTHTLIADIFSPVREDFIY